MESKDWLQTRSTKRNKAGFDQTTSTACCPTVGHLLGRQQHAGVEAPYLAFPFLEGFFNHLCSDCQVLLCALLHSVSEFGHCKRKLLASSRKMLEVLKRRRRRESRERAGQSRPCLVQRCLIPQTGRLGRRVRGVGNPVGLRVPRISGARTPPVRLAVSVAPSTPA